MSYRELVFDYIEYLKHSFKFPDIARFLLRTKRDEIGDKRVKTYCFMLHLSMGHNRLEGAFINGLDGQLKRDFTIEKQSP